MLGYLVRLYMYMSRFWKLWNRRQWRNPLQSPSSTKPTWWNQKLLRVLRLTLPWSPLVRNRKFLNQGWSLPNENNLPWLPKWAPPQSQYQDPAIHRRCIPHKTIAQSVLSSSKNWRMKVCLLGMLKKGGTIVLWRRRFFLPFRSLNWLGDGFVPREQPPTPGLNFILISII